MKTLHILRKTTDVLAMEIIHETREIDTVVVLLIQDGVLARGNFPDETYVCQDDISARGLKSPFPQINYPGIARLITECGRVITW